MQWNDNKAQLELELELEIESADLLYVADSERTRLRDERVLTHF